MRSFSDIVCNAFTFLEFDGEYALYKADRFNREEDDKALAKAWAVVLADHKLLSAYMDDDAIESAFNFIMNEL